VVYPNCLTKAGRCPCSCILCRRRIYLLTYVYESITCDLFCNVVRYMNLSLTVTRIIQRLDAILANTLMGHISSENTFNGLHFCRRLNTSVFILLSVVSCRSWRKLWEKKSKNRPTCDASVRGHRIWKDICDFLLVARFPSYGEISVKICMEIRRWLTYRPTVAKK